MNIFPFLLLTAVASANDEWFLSDLREARTCEPIRIKSCDDIGYNVTIIRNLAGHDVQKDTAMLMQSFSSLIQYGCSSRLRFFLCSAYVPMCTEKVPQPIGPCRPLCESVRDLCEPVLQEFGFQWPRELNCDLFPRENNEIHMCMEGPAVEEQKHVPLRRPTRPGQSRSNTRPRQLQNYYSARAQSRIMCKHLRASDRYYYKNTTKRCIPSCRADHLYSRANKFFVTVWMGVWSSLCAISTLYTIIVFFKNTENFRYPEKVVVILSSCNLIYSITFFIRLIGGSDVMSCYWEPNFGEYLLVQSGLENTNCTIVFTLLYFFGMASFIWWVILSLNWFLTAGLGWNTEVLERFGNYFHVTAWLVPAIKTTAILVMQAVDADELTGMCYVGNQDPQSMVRFVLVPSVMYLAVGLIFLIAGLFAIFKNKTFRSTIRSSEERWEVFEIRIAIFAILYTVPAIGTLIANFYEFALKEEWLAVNSNSRPHVEIFTIKIFLSLVVGITSGLWLYTSKTLKGKRLNFNVKGKLCNPDTALPECSSQNQALLLNSTQHKITNV